MANQVELVARAIAGHFGPVFDGLPTDEIQRREWNRSPKAGCAGNLGPPYEESQADLLEAAKDAIRAMKGRGDEQIG